MNAGFLQFNPVFGDIRGNVDRVTDLIQHAEFDLLVLPELFSTGYQFIAHEEVHALAEEIPSGYSTSALVDTCRQKGCFLAFGLAERDGAKFYNSAALIGPEGFIGVYRKAHLFGREKTWFSPGDTGFQAWDTDLGSIGLMICFDWFFPESARILALKGAELIAHPSNLVLPYCPQSMPLRCLENRVYAITANRTGTEHRTPDTKYAFIGRSQITGPDGEVIRSASPTEDEVSVVSLDLQRARNKNITALDDLFRDRRTDLYGAISAPRGQADRAP